MEEKLDNLLTECLINNTVPFTAEKLHQCNENVLSATAIFSFGHSIHYVPTNCFNGLTIRRRQCDEVRACCPAMLRCSTIPTQSELAKSIEKVRLNMIDRAKQCENGSEIEKLQLPPLCLGNDQIDSQHLQHLKDRVTEITDAKKEESKSRQGEIVDVSSGKDSGHEINSSGYGITHAPTGYREAAVTSTIDATGSGYTFSPTLTDDRQTAVPTVGTASSIYSTTQMPTDSSETTITSTVIMTGNGYGFSQIPTVQTETAVPTIGSTGSVYSTTQMPTESSETTLASTVEMNGSGKRSGQIPADEKETAQTSTVDTAGSGERIDQIPTEDEESALTSTVDIAGSGERNNQIATDDRETTLASIVDTTGSGERIDQILIDGRETISTSTADTTGSGYEISHIPAESKETTLASILQYDTTGSGYIDGSGAIPEESSLLRDGNNEDVQKQLESTTSALVYWL